MDGAFPEESLQSTLSGFKHSNGLDVRLRYTQSPTVSVQCKFYALP